MQTQPHNQDLAALCADLVAYPGYSATNEEQNLLTANIWDLALDWGPQRKEAGNGKSLERGGWVQRKNMREAKSRWRFKPPFQSPWEKLALRKKTSEISLRLIHPLPMKWKEWRSLKMTFKQGFKTSRLWHRWSSATFLTFLKLNFLYKNLDVLNVELYFPAKWWETQCHHCVKRLTGCWIWLCSLRATKQELPQFLHLRGTFRGRFVMAKWHGLQTWATDGKAKPSLQQNTFLWYKDGETDRIRWSPKIKHGLYN